MCARCSLWCGLQFSGVGGATHTRILRGHCRGGGDTLPAPAWFAEGLVRPLHHGLGLQCFQLLCHHREQIGRHCHGRAAQ